MLAWFATFGLLGLAQIVQYPAVLAALDPRYALGLFGHAGWQAFVALGAIVLAVTGAEALYADIGHFGRTPIRLAWLVSSSRAWSSTILARALWSCAIPRRSSTRSTVCICTGPERGAAGAATGSRGFGLELIERSVAHELSGQAVLDYRVEGLSCGITVPLTDSVGTCVSGAQRPASSRRRFELDRQKARQSPP